MKGILHWKAHCIKKHCSDWTKDLDFFPKYSWSTCTEGWKYLFHQPDFIQPISLGILNLCSSLSQKPAPIPMLVTKQEALEWLLNEAQLFYMKWCVKVKKRRLHLIIRYEFIEGIFHNPLIVYCIRKIISNFIHILERWF